MAPPILKRFFISLGQHKILGFLSFALIFGTSVIIALQPSPETVKTYKALGRLSFSNPPPIFTSTGEILQQQGRVVSLQVLLAPRVLEQVATQLQITPEQMGEILETRLKIIFPEPEDLVNPLQPQVITIEYLDTNPERAVFVLNLFMDKMVDQSLWLNSSQLKARIDSLQQRLEKVKDDLRNAEAGFYRYISTTGSDLLSIQDGSLFVGITSSKQQQRLLEEAIQEVDGQMSSLISQLGLTPDQAYTSSALSADPIIGSLRAQILQNETQIKILGKDLRPEHPRMIELQKQQETFEKLLQERAEEIIGDNKALPPLPAQIRKESNLDPARQALANTLVALQAQKQGLVRQLQSVKDTEKQLRQEYEQFPDKQLEQARLIQSVQSQRILYQTILAALTDARAAEAEATSSLAVVQPAVPVEQPTLLPETSPIIIMSAGGILGLVASIGIIFLLATVDDRLHTLEEIREALSEKDVPILGELPYVVSFDRNGEKVPIIMYSDSAYLPFYERFRSNLRLMGRETAKIIIVTSLRNEEGKSVTAYNLAIASAYAGKRTLLIEADLRSPTGAKIFGIEPNSLAKSEPLRFYAGDSINLVPDIENLYILPSPGPQAQPAAIIESNELQRLLKDARGRFDLVIVDTPSLSNCNDALLIEPLADGIVLVTRPGFTQKSLLQETIDEFIQGELPLLGAVINDVEKLAAIDTFSPPPSIIAPETIPQPELASQDLN